MLIDGNQQAPRRGQALILPDFSLLRHSEEAAAEFRTARAQGLGRDVGLCVRPSLAPSQLGGWKAGKAGGLQAHKKEWLVLLPDESAPGWAGREGCFYCLDISAYESVLLAGGEAGRDLCFRPTYR